MRSHKRSSSIGDKISHFFTDTIGGNIKKAFNWVTGGISHAVSVVHKDVRDVVKGINHLAVKTEDTLAGTVKEINHNMTDLGIAVSGDVKDLGSNVTKNISNMAMPLAIGAVAVAAVMMMKK